MPDFEFWLDIIMEFAADNSTELTVGTIIFGLASLLIFKRHKYLRPYLILIMISGPALSFFAGQYYGEEVKKALSGRELNTLVVRARYDFDVFKRNMDLAVKAGKIQRSGADKYLQEARRYYRAFSEKLNSVPRAQRKNFRELRMRFKDEVKDAEKSLGEIELE